ncbi:phosphotransferase family protein [Desertihabitans aurantiacus]|uniref:phosphotransferase family protein n=1 Tax=Desertihabitans aurantiacus TaxID=2282477 RepID=UPI000DF7865B|nr:phosphotransferase [Desertihabitans aurantiacus]
MLLTEAGLPEAVALDAVDDDGEGLDNQLWRVTLQDGSTVLLRQSKVLSPSPRTRVDFLRHNGVPVPVLHAADDTGHALWEYVPGATLASSVEQGVATESMWARTGQAFAAVHAAEFPAPLQGAITLDGVDLRPLDPVEQLLTRIEASRSWAADHLEQAEALLDRVTAFVDANSHRIRAERPAVTHGDTNLLNIIVDDHSVSLIDWDYPAVRYPLDELSALDEHAHLHGLDGLPSAFFTGYGRPVAPDLLFAYRAVGCLGWLRSDEWLSWQSDPGLPEPAQHRLRHWHSRLLTWVTEEFPRAAQDLLA